MTALHLFNWPKLADSIATETHAGNSCCLRKVYSSSPEPSSGFITSQTAV